ncbi:MAG: Gamma-glutamyltranspeptidase precursor [Planctomycetota bacterium]|jgi:gamma-glutamyltranspeptidase/glutathione hydrolase
MIQSSSRRHTFAFIGRSTVGLLLAALCVSVAPAQPRTDAGPHQYPRGVVAADHPAASAAGAKILKQGGNVVDAAVATSFALSVVRPASCGIGGGGFMVIWKAADQTAVALDYRERAPAQCTPELYANTQPSPAEALSVRGGLACGIPGTVAGLCLAAQRYGSLPLADLLQPAIELCEQGVPVDDHDIEVQTQTLEKLRRIPGYEQRFAVLIDLYLNKGRPWQHGDRFHSPQAPVLKAIARHGPAAFYEGAVAEAIVSTVRAEHGVLSGADLAGYQPSIREPLKGSFRGRTVLTMPPPSSGGVALLQSLQALEHWEKLSGTNLETLRHNSPRYIHVVSEILKHAFADRAEFLGDTDFVKVPVTRLLSSRYAAHIAAQINPEGVLEPARYGRFFLNDDGGTSHFSVMDAAGNAVACTETINLAFGSFVVVPQYGILLNNEMDDFSAQPGKPNAFGLLQSASNGVQPGKRPLSSMTPTIVLEDGRAVISAGASGGPRIITATLQNLLNQMVFNLPPADAVSAPRFHHQWSPNELLLEKSLFENAAADLAKTGHQLRLSGGLAATQATAASTTTPTALLGGSDPRKHGSPDGY